MSVKAIMEGDWSEYDNAAITDSRDGNFFSCNEEWEVNYLINKIHAQFPQVTKVAIKTAIMSSCREMSAPRPRKAFVESVTRRLGLWS